MNKDDAFKDSSNFDNKNLRQRISEGIKSVRDEAPETKDPQAKSMPVIPVTGSDSNSHKYFNNKSQLKF